APPWFFTATERNVILRRAQDNTPVKRIILQRAVQYALGLLVRLTTDSIMLKSNKLITKRSETMKKNHLIIALVMLMSASLCLAQASKQRKSRKSSTAKAAQTHVMPACSIGDIRITSKAKGTRCLHLVSVPPVGEPPPEGLFVACPYPQK